MEHLQNIDGQLSAKQENLREYLRGLGSVAVAFSGGVDSTFLLKTAHDELGERAVAVTARSCSFPARETREAADFCAREGIRQILIDFDELAVPGFAQNPKNRCYLCKKELFGKILQAARENDIRYVAEGSNTDDTGDYRPGLQAVAELGILSPLQRARLGKQEIRALSKALGLPTWGKPSYACLASRFVYGEAITREKLSMVDQAEQLLLDLGFRQMRVRIHGSMARIEVLPEDFPKVTAEDVRRTIVKKFREYGFSYVSLDLQGYRTGSMNEVLK